MMANQTGERPAQCICCGLTGEHAKKCTTRSGELYVTTVQAKARMLRVRMLIGVLSAAAFEDRRRACRATWMRDLDGEAAVAVFIIGDPALSEPELRGDELWLPCPDTYDCLPQKTRLFCEWAQKHAEFEYVFKCDDDTYVCVPRLTALPSGLGYVGAKIHGRDYASGGAGYLLSPPAVAILAEDVADERGSEDRAAGGHLADAGVDVVYDHRFRPLSAACDKPAPDNDIITAHYCNPDSMRAIYDTLGGDRLTWRHVAENPNKTTFTDSLKAGDVTLALWPPGSMVPGGPRADLWFFVVMGPVSAMELPEGMTGTHIMAGSGFAGDRDQARNAAVEMALALLPDEMTQALRDGLAASAVCDGEIA